VRAANYVKDQLTQWGLTNAILDAWGGFGKSWELEKNLMWPLPSPGINQYWKLIQKVWIWEEQADCNKCRCNVITATDSAGP